MLRVQVIADGELIGECDLFAEDPPTGVASGVLRPTPVYAKLRDRHGRFVATGSQVLNVELRTQDGQWIVAVGGTVVEDCTPEPGEVRRVTVMGIESPDYEASFGTDPHYEKYYSQ